MDAKKVCDGECNTCSTENKVHCALYFSKKNNEMLAAMLQSQAKGNGGVMISPESQDAPCPQAKEDEDE